LILINVIIKTKNLNTKLLLTASTLFLGVIGVGFSFFPKEILMYLDIDATQMLTFMAQILGALFLGFAMMNWMARGSIIGGIYNRPIAIGNFMHFALGAITLLKITFKAEVHVGIIISLTVFYTLFALSFAYVFFTNPTMLGSEN